MNKPITRKQWLAWIKKAWKKAQEKMIDKSAFKIEFMGSYSNKQLFKNRACLSLLLKRRGSSLETKRKIVMMANSPLFYAFRIRIQRKRRIKLWLWNRIRSSRNKGLQVLQSK